jgi:hypothetical protein
MGQFDFKAALVLVRLVQSGGFHTASEAFSMPKPTKSR